LGNAAVCTVRLAGKTFSGKAQLESSEIIFRGETRLKIPVDSITAVRAKNGQLEVRTKDGFAVFDLGPKAAKWCEKIANPTSLLDKLGVKAGQSVSLIGNFAAEFLGNLKKHGAVISKNKAVADSSWIFFWANEKRELGQLPPLAKFVLGTTGLWLVYPKGQKTITEADVRSAGLKVGLVDVKVVSFSATHTALKFVLRKSKR
jgi:hypothetical protein